MFCSNLELVRGLFLLGYILSVVISRNVQMELFQVYINNNIIKFILISYLFLMLNRYRRRAVALTGNSTEEALRAATSFVKNDGLSVTKKSIWDHLLF